MDQISPFISSDLVEKLDNAISNPEKVKGTVSIKAGKDELFRVKDGQVLIDKLELSNPKKQTKNPENIESLQKQIETLNNKLQEQQELVSRLKSQPQAHESIEKLYIQAANLSKSLEKQQKTIDKTQKSLERLSKAGIPNMQNSKLQNWVGAIESKVKNTAIDTFERVKETLSPLVSKGRDSLEKMKSEITENFSNFKEQMQTQVDGVKSQVKQGVDQVRQNVDNKIQDTRQKVNKTVSQAKSKAIEGSVKTLLNHLGEKQEDGSISFTSKNFNFQQQGDTINVKTKDGTDVIKDGALSPEVTPEQITELEQVQPVVDEYLKAEADLEYAQADLESIQVEAENVELESQSLESSQSLSKGLSR